MADFTEKAIKDSFIRLLEERPLNRITVKDIARTCGINRNTFYYHYQDIPALLLDIIREDAQEIFNAYAAMDSILDCVDAVTRKALENRWVVMNIYNSINRDIYEHYIWELAQYTVSLYFDSVLKDHELGTEDREMLIRYAKCECFGLITDWLENDMDENILNGLRRMMGFRQEQLESMILRLEKESRNADKKGTAEVK